jgi:PDZ domain
MKKLLMTAAFVAVLSLGWPGHSGAQTSGPGGQGGAQPGGLGGAQEAAQPGEQPGEESPIGAEESPQPDTTPVTPENAGDQQLPNNPDVPSTDNEAPSATERNPLSERGNLDRDDRTPRETDLGQSPDGDPARDNDRANESEESQQENEGNVGDRAATRSAQFDPGFEFQTGGAAGLTIGNVTSDSVAGRAGLRANDRIISIDGRTFNSANDFRMFAPRIVGRRVPIVIERGGRRQTVFILYPRSATESYTRSNGRPWLGVYLEPQYTGNGALVSRVAHSGPAARAGLVPGDVIVSVNGQDTYGYRDVMARVSELTPNASVELYVSRDGQSIPIVATVGRRQETAYRGSNANGYDRFGDDRLPPSPEAWSTQGYSSHDERLDRLERMVEDLQLELRELRSELGTNRR